MRFISLGFCFISGLKWNMFTIHQEWIWNIIASIYRFRKFLSSSAMHYPYRNNITPKNGILLPYISCCCPRFTLELWQSSNLFTPCNSLRIFPKRLKSIDSYIISMDNVRKRSNLYFHLFSFGIYCSVDVYLNITIMTSLILQSILISPPYPRKIELDISFVYIHINVSFRKHQFLVVLGLWLIYRTLL